MQYDTNEPGKPRVIDDYCIPAIYYCTLRKMWELLHSGHNRKYDSSYDKT